MAKDIEIYGEITHIRFRNDEGWSVFTLTDDNQNETPCTGTLQAMVSTGDMVNCHGYMTTGKFGEQLKCKSIVPDAPDTNSDEGISRLLQKLPGIGPVKAELCILEHGATEAWELAQTDPAQLGVKKNKIEETIEMAKSFAEDYGSIVFLLGAGLTDNQASKIIKVFGEETISVVTNNPYILIDKIDGFGFMIVDGIALKLGINAGSMARIMACVMFLLNSSENDGHTYFHGKRICCLCENFLIESAKKHEVRIVNMPGYQEAREAIYILRDNGKVTISEGRVFSNHLLKCEDTIYNAIKK